MEAMKNTKIIFDDDLREVMQYPQVRKVTERLQSRLDAKAEKKGKAMKGTVAELKKMLNNMNDQDLIVASERDHVVQALPTIIEVLVFGKKRTFKEELLEWNGDPREYGYPDMKALQADGGKIVKAIVLR
jgi:hypothetical protein